MASTPKGGQMMRLTPMERRLVETLRTLQAQAGYDADHDYAAVGTTLVVAREPGPGATEVAFRAFDLFTAPSHYSEAMKAVLSLGYARQLRYRMGTIEAEREKLLARARLLDGRAAVARAKIH